MARCAAVWLQRLKPGSDHDGIGVYALFVGGVVALALNGARINETTTDEVEVETVDA